MSLVVKCRSKINETGWSEFSLISYEIFKQRCLEAKEIQSMWYSHDVEYSFLGEVFVIKAGEKYQEAGAKVLSFLEFAIRKEKLKSI
jgi:hypothetical protein